MPFCPFCFRVPLLKLNIRKKGTLIVKGLLRNLESLYFNVLKRVKGNLYFKHARRCSLLLEDWWDIPLYEVQGGPWYTHTPKPKPNS